MLKLIVQVLLVLLVFRLLGSLVSALRRRGEGRARFDRSREKASVNESDYSELTPYEIEDAEYEDIPKRE